eukprot:Skav201712  [mRNA]  locus=scaffold311:160972:161328:+ [translate_table: standard]
MEIFAMKMCEFDSLPFIKQVQNPVLNKLLHKCRSSRGLHPSLRQGKQALAYWRAMWHSACPDSKRSPTISINDKTAIPLMGSTGAVSEMFAACAACAASATVGTKTRRSALHFLQHSK